MSGLLISVVSGLRLLIYTMKEQKVLKNALEKRRSEKFFINDLVSKNPELKEFFHKYDFCISKELNELENKNSFIENIFHDIEKSKLKSSPE